MKCLCVLEIPDILTASQCKMLKNWNGELRYLPNFKFTRFSKKQLNDALQEAKKQPKVHTNKKGEQFSDKPEKPPGEIVSESAENTPSNTLTVSTKNNQATICSMEIE